MGKSDYNKFLFSRDHGGRPRHSVPLPPAAKKPRPGQGPEYFERLRERTAARQTACTVPGQRLEQQEEEHVTAEQAHNVAGEPTHPLPDEPHVPVAQNFQQPPTSATTTHLPGIRVSVRQSRTQAHRRQRDEIGWQCFRSSSVQAYLAHACPQHEQLQQVLAHHASMLAGIVGIAGRHDRDGRPYMLLDTGTPMTSCCCPTCGLEAAQCVLQRIIDVTYVELTYRFMLKVPVFRCTRCAMQPDGRTMQFAAHPFSCGAFPATPVLSVDLTRCEPERDKPMWFGMQLLQFVHTIRMVNADVFIDSLADAICKQHDINECAAPLATDTLRKDLGKAVEEYGYMMDSLNDLQSLGMDAGQAQSDVLSKCPACSGAAKVVQLPSGRAIRIFHSGYFDGNFRLNHFCTAGTACQFPPAIQRIFVDDCDVKEFCSLPSSQLPDAAPTACSDFVADEALGRKAAKYDITAVGGLFCRHGILLLAMNFFTGERWAYSSFALHKLLCSENVWLRFWWYDINCRYKHHWDKYLREASGLDEELVNLASCSQFPVPPWHINMHNASCQTKNSARTMVGAGRGAGEPPEAGWSFLGRHGRTTQRMSLPNRQAHLEMVAAQMNRRKVMSLPDLMPRMYIKALQQRDSANEELQAILAEVEANASRLDAEQVRQLEELRPQQLEAADDFDRPVLSSEAQYVRAVLEMQHVVQGNQGVLPVTLLFSSRQLGQQFNLESRYVKTLFRRVSSLEAEVCPDGAWVLDGEEFQAALVQLCRYEIQCLQQSIPQLVREYRHLLQLLVRLQGARKDTKRLLRTMTNQRNKVKAQVTKLQAWAGQAVEAPMSELLLEDEELAAMRQCADLPTTTLLDQVLAAQYPWGEDSKQSYFHALSSKMKLQLDLIARANEELDLLEEEMLGVARALHADLTALCELDRQLEAQLLNVTQQLHMFLTGGADGSQPTSDALCGQQQLAQQQRVLLSQRYLVKRQHTGLHSCYMKALSLAEDLNRSMPQTDRDAALVEALDDDSWSDAGDAGASYGDDEDEWEFDDDCDVEVEVEGVHHD